MSTKLCHLQYVDNSGAHEWGGVTAHIPRALRVLSTHRRIFVSLRQRIPAAIIDRSTEQAVLVISGRPSHNSTLELCRADLAPALTPTLMFQHRRIKRTIVQGRGGGLCRFLLPSLIAYEVEDHVHLLHRQPSKKKGYSSGTRRTRPTFPLSNDLTVVMANVFE